MSRSPRRLPPLKAARAFEAAARHLSFTKAADELAVTQAAVSQQIKALEEYYGRPLFRRLNRRLLLTDAGQILLPVLSEAFDRIAETSGRLTQRQAEGALAVTVLPSFAQRWLLPRLPEFNAKHPEIDGLIAASHEVEDFSSGRYDLAIRYGGGRYPGLKTIRLMPDYLMPLCSPRLLEGAHPLRRPADLAHHTLLHDSIDIVPYGQDWAAWLGLANQPQIDAGRGPGFSDSGMVLAAAVAGQGVAMGRHWLALDDLKAGRLVQPFGPVMDGGFAYYLVAPPDSFRRPRVTAFCDWLIERTQRDQEDSDRLIGIEEVQGVGMPGTGGV